MQRKVSKHSIIGLDTGVIDYSSSVVEFWVLGRNKSVMQVQCNSPSALFCFKVLNIVRVLACSHFDFTGRFWQLAFLSWLPLSPYHGSVWWKGGSIARIVAHTVNYLLSFPFITGANSPSDLN